MSLSLPRMDRPVAFDAEQPFFIFQGKNCLSGSGHSELGDKGETVAHSQTSVLQTGLGGVVRGAHTQNQLNRLLGVGLDELAQVFGQFAAL